MMNEHYEYIVEDMNHASMMLSINLDGVEEVIRLKGGHSFKMGSQEHFELIRIFENITSLLRYSAFAIAEKNKE